jgi:DedD protein
VVHSAANLTQQIQDDGFHEIQLNGKQLVFLFMAATVVSVVIFLCGVLVGRGVKAERLATAEAPPVNVTAETTPQQPATPPPTPTPVGSDPTVAAAPPPVDDLTYDVRLDKPHAASEQLKAKAKNELPAPMTVPAQPRPSPAQPPAKAAVKAEARAGSTPPAMVASKPASASTLPSLPAATGDGYAVQIAAVNERGEADAMAKRLTSKGYSAYVLAPAAGTPSMYRVRIGKFPTKREADTMAAKLQKEEQFKPWVTR